MRSVLFLVLEDRCLSDLSKLGCTGSDISNFRFVLMSDFINIDINDMNWFI